MHAPPPPPKAHKVYTADRQAITLDYVGWGVNASSVKLVPDIPLPLPPPSPAAEPGGGSSGLSGGAVAGIVVGCVVGGCLLAALVALLLVRRRRYTVGQGGHSLESISEWAGGGAVRSPVRGTGIRVVQGGHV